MSKKRPTSGIIGYVKTEECPVILQRNNVIRARAVKRGKNKTKA